MIENAFVAFGGNLGDRDKNLCDVLKEFGIRRFHLKSIARVYWSRPADGVQGGDFLNTVFEFKRDQEISEFFEALQRIEIVLGSQNMKSGGERTCDLDLLLWGEDVISSPKLTVPHPRLHLRDFVLAPLSDLIPNEKLPRIGQTPAELLAAVEERYIIGVHTMRCS